MAKNNVLIYTDYMEQMECLSMEERGILFTAILNYQAGLPMPKMDKLLNLVFIPIRQQLDRDNAAYMKKCEARAEAGRKGGIAKANNAKQSLANLANASFDKQSLANLADNDNENDTENENVNDNDNENDTYSVVLEPQHPLSEAGNGFEDKVIAEWNKIHHVVKVDRIVPMTRRYDELRICVGIVGEQGIIDAIHKVAESKYLKTRGNVRFDNYINRNAVQILLEGGYDEEYKKPQPQQEKKVDNFNNFQQREYNFSELEEKLMNRR